MRGAWKSLLGLALATATVSTGCVTVAEHRKLEKQVIDMQRSGTGETPPLQRLADLGARLEAMEARLDRMEGGIEVAEHRSDEALAEARAARKASAQGAPAGIGDVADVPPAPGDEGANSEEIQAYREAYSAWRDDEAELCVDRFREFLQTYESSAYADDAAYWMADCHFKQGDYKTAVLRFDDVVKRYPSGNKAADALFRQGEALMRLGPGYGKAAGKAFQRVLKEYPDSARAPEAERQLELLGSG